MHCGPCVTNNNSYIYTLPVFSKRSKRSFFTNNALVYYKPTSLPSCPVGTVRNASIASKRI